MTTEYLLLWAAPVGGIIIALVVLYLNAQVASHADDARSASGAGVEIPEITRIKQIYPNSR